MIRLPALGPRGEGWVVIQLVLLGGIVVAGKAGPAWDGTPRVITSLASGVLLVAGGVLAARGLLDLREALTPLPHPREGAQLVDSGSYALVRHPIYGGLVLGATGYGLLLASPPALAGAVVLLGFLRLKSGREELWLIERYPGYEAYRRRTRRLLPFVW